jgi:putative SOS response-associated peptidase YedK
MCYNVQQKAIVKELTEAFQAQFKNPTLYQSKETINGFDFPFLPVLKSDQPTSFQFLQWGLIPAWAKDESIQKSTLNAKMETIHDKPSFKMVTENRCVLPVTGFFEWKWLDSKGKRKEKYFIQVQEESLFGLAGLHTNWQNPNSGESKETFTLLTTKVNPVMAEIHNIKKRMPLIMDV